MVSHDSGEGWIFAEAVRRYREHHPTAQPPSLAGYLCEQCQDAWPSGGRPRPRATRGGSVRTAHHRNTQGGQTGMAESWRGTRIREGQRWLQAAVEAVLAQASIPLAARAAHQPAVYWETQTGTRRSLYLWLAEEATPRQLPFPSTLIEDCGADHGCAMPTPASISSGVSDRWDWCLPKGLSMARHTKAEAARLRD